MRDPTIGLRILAILAETGFNPRRLELEITETGPSFKGDTAAGGTKPATLETGVVVQVPLFLNTGDRVKVDTRTDTYLERVK